MKKETMQDKSILKKSQARYFMEGTKRGWAGAGGARSVRREPPQPVYPTATPPSNEAATLQLLLIEGHKAEY